MLLGAYEGRIDAQGRVVIPQKLRESLEQGMVLARGFDGSVDVYPPQQWSETVAHLEKFSTYNADARLAQRLMFSGAFNATMDRQGRVVIPPALRQFAGIAEEVIIAGAGRRVEIWARDRWEAQERQSENLPKIASTLETLEGGRRP